MKIDDKILSRDHTLNQDDRTDNDTWLWKAPVIEIKRTRLALLRTCAWIALLFLLAMAVVGVICLRAHV